MPSSILLDQDGIPCWILSKDWNKEIPLTGIATAFILDEELRAGSNYVGSAVQASLRIRKISLTGPFHSPISFASTTQNQPNTLSIAYDA